VVTLTAALEPGPTCEVTDLIAVATELTGRGVAVGAAVAFGAAVGVGEVVVVGAVIPAGVAGDPAVPPHATRNSRALATSANLAWHIGSPPNGGTRAMMLAA
jgi:hypothetical protein